MIYLVTIGCDCYHYCKTYEDAVAMVNRVKGHHCQIFKLVADKNVYTDEIKEIKEEEK